MQANRSKGLAMIAASSPSRESSLDELRAIIRDGVLGRRHHGLKRAQEMVARIIKTTVRRVRAWWAGEVTSVTDWEAASIRAAKPALYLQELEDLDARRASLAARIEALKEKQNEPSREVVVVVGEALDGAGRVCVREGGSLPAEGV